MLFELLFFPAIGELLIVLGLLVWRRQKITLIHEYHWRNVRKKDRAAYTRLIGQGLAVMGAGIDRNGFLRSSDTWPGDGKLLRICPSDAEYRFVSAGNAHSRDEHCIKADSLSSRTDSRRRLSKTSCAGLPRKNGQRESRTDRNLPRRRENALSRMRGEEKCTGTKHIAIQRR